MQKQFNQYSVGAWNTNGWNSTTNPDNRYFKENALKMINLDIFLISESHCLREETLEIAGFKTFQYNRSKISNRAIKGSGGVAIAINNRLLINHTVITVYKGNSDGILAVKLKNNDCDAFIGIVVNYLSPDTFHYGRDPEGYFADNAVIWSDLSDCDLVVGGGDLNSRTKNELDYLPEIDGKLVSPRSNPDHIKNSHGGFFLQFLKDNRALICNGRITPELNDFTFLGVRGRSVPDYVYCPADHIQYCKSVKVYKVSDIINDFDLDIPNSLPDHSMIVSHFDISTNCDFLPSVPKTNPADCFSDSIPAVKNKKNVKKIGETFFMSEEVLSQINDTIRKIEIMNINQNTLNEIYAEIKSLFLAEMSKLPDLPSSNCKQGRRQKRKANPFWNDELNDLWVIRCN